MSALTWISLDLHVYIYSHKYFKSLWYWCEQPLWKGWTISQLLIEDNLLNESDNMNNASGHLWTYYFFPCVLPGFEIIHFPKH